MAAVAGRFYCVDPVTSTARWTAARRGGGQGDGDISSMSVFRVLIKPRGFIQSQRGTMEGSGTIFIDRVRRGSTNQHRQAVEMEIVTSDRAYRNSVWHFQGQPVG